MPKKIAPPSPPYVGPPKFHGGNNRPIERIVIHCTAGAEPGVQNAARNTAAYTKGTSRPSSWHYCADSRESVQLTYDSVVAFHDGTNDHSISYEMCCSLSNEGGVIVKAKAGVKALTHWQTPAHRAMLKIAAKDCARLALANDIPIRKLSVADVRADRKGFCGHNTMRDAFPGRTTHWDPGPFFPWARFLRMVRAEAKILLAEDTPPPPPPEPKPTRTLRGGSWNLRVGRRPEFVVFEVAKLLKTQRLDFLAICEAADYTDALEKGHTDPTGHLIPPLVGYTVHVKFDGDGPARDSAVIVRDGLKVTDLRTHRLERIGWERKPGRIGLHWPRKATSVDVEGLGVLAVHMPPGPFKGPRFWRRGVAFDTSARKLRRIFLRWSGRPWVAPGDWNMRKRVAGTEQDPSVAWIAAETDAQIEGDGIDYVMHNDCLVTNYRRHRFGTSDHEPTTFDVQY